MRRVDVTSGETTARRLCFVLALSLALTASESQAVTRRSCRRDCRRFGRQCVASTAKRGRCQRLLHRLDKCRQRLADVACEAITTTTSSTTTTTIAGSGTTVTTTSSTTTTTIAGVVTVDAARAASKTFPLEGGTLTATGADGTVYSLTIPPGALLVETAITMTPIVSIASGALPDEPLVGVDLQPSGLRLYEFADLTITPPELGPDADIAGFSYEGDGEDLHAYPARLEDGRILLHVIHFSGAGANICVELCPPPIVPPPPAITESELEQLIASLDPHDPFYAPRLAELLHGYYDLFIAPNLPLMEQSCDYATSRIPKVLAWSRTNQILLAEEGFESENQTIGNSVVKSVSNCWAEATKACLNPNDAYQVQNLLQISRQAQLLGADPAEFDLSQLRRCSGLWSGTITLEWRYDEDGDFYQAGGHVMRRGRLLRTQVWQVMPHVIANPCADSGCSARMYETTWTGSTSEDDLYVTEYPNCIDKTTLQGALDGSAPSALDISTSPDQSTFNVTRASPGILGAPPLTNLSQEFQGTHLWCAGYEEPVAGLLSVWESWDYYRFPKDIPLGRTDPTIPVTSEGQKVDRQVSNYPDGSSKVITNTVSWKLTLEPDAAQ